MKYDICVDNNIIHIFGYFDYRTHENSHLPKASSKQNNAETFSDDKIWGAKDEVELAMVA